VPLLATFPWLTRLTPYHGELTPSLTPGRTPAWFRIGDLKLATAICFESTIPHVVRRAFREVGDGHPPDVLLNLSNDGWFRGSAELDNSLAISVFRAVEHRVPLARAVNTGISALIDGNGRIVARLPKLANDVIVARVPLDDREGLYAVVGDWLPWCCLIATVLMLFPSFPLLSKSPITSGLPAPPG
jgi:apolipoprotein N-acyltransferase